MLPTSLLYTPVEDVRVFLTTLKLGHQLWPYLFQVEFIKSTFLLHILLVLQIMCC